MEHHLSADGGPVGSSIAEVTGQCRESLQDCLHCSPLMRYEWAENRLAEFKLWAAGTGALASDRASLDVRLAIESETKKLVVNILILLRACIERCRQAGEYAVSLIHLQANHFIKP
jgi:hypothetical protein